MWVDGYWQGAMRDGYPSSYFTDEGSFEYPWQKDNRVVSSAVEHESLKLHVAGSIPVRPSKINLDNGTKY